MNKFRVLRADEIDCRVAQIKRNGLSLLLYKDARCDQNILDETVGPMNWQRSHSRDNANCTVSIWDNEKKMWISKEDTGTESNTEKEKGLASDSFKRACFNWGIGRELYSAPFIWVSDKDANISEKDGKFYCYDRFTVHGIGYNAGSISGLEIKNQKTGKICYRFGSIQDTAPDKPEQPDTEPGNEKPTRPAAPAKVGDAVVTQIKAAPEPVKKTNEVETYINSGIAFMADMFQITKDEMKPRFVKMRKALIEAKIVPDIKSSEMTMEQAQDLIDAMVKTFMTDKKEDA